MVLSVTLWMAGLLTHKVVSEEIPLLTMLIWHLGLTSAVLWVVDWFFSRPRPPVRKYLAGIARGLIAPGMVLIFNGLASRYLDGTTLIAFWGLVPLLVPIAAYVMLRETLSGSVMIGAAIAFAGVLTLAQLRGQTAITWWGVVLGLTCVCLAVIGAVLGRFLNRGKPHWVAMAVSQCTGAFICVSIAGVITGAPFVLPELDISQFWLFGYMIFGMGLLNFLTYNYGLGRVPVGFGMLYTALSPLIGALLSWLWLYESLTSLQFMLLLSCLIGALYPHGVRLWITYIR